MPKRIATHASDKSPATVRKPQRGTLVSDPQSARLNPINAFARVQASRSSELSASDILALQRTAGNRAVGHLLAQQIRAQETSAHRSSPVTIQAKLAVGPADDAYEREADRISETVTQTSESSLANIQRMPLQEKDEELIQAKPLVSSITPLIQRQEISEGEEETDSKDVAVQRRAGGGLASVEPGTENDIEQARGSGHMLPPDLRVRMEQAFGADFSGVRVHADSKSDNLNRSLRSRAFTTGQDLFFKAGEFAPASKEGRKLIAHELTHVVQQTGGVSRRGGVSVQRAPGNVIQRSISEAVMEDRKSWKMMSWKLKTAMVAAAPVLQPFVQAWESGKAVATPVYKYLAGNKPGILRAFLSGLVATPGALIGSVYGLAKGFLRGLVFGLGNPLYSIGKRIGNFSPSAAIGIYDAKPTHPKYQSEEDEKEVNYNAETKTDLANYGLLVGGTGSAVGKFIADKANVIGQVEKASSFKDFFTKSWGVITDNTPNVSDTGKVLSHVGAVSSGLGALASLVDAKKGYDEFREKASTSEQQRIGLGKAASSTLSAAQQSATSAYHIGTLAQTGVAATAEVATGGLGVATGAVDVLRGGYSFFKARQNVGRLNRLERDETLHEDTRKAATQAASTQGMRKTAALGTVAKGVLTAVGGGLLAASVVTPIGWLLLAGGALIGGVMAIKKWWDKRKRKKEIAIRELGVEDERKEWEADVEKVKSKYWFWSEQGKIEREALGPDPLERELKRHGFKDVGHFYANYINYMANHLYNRAKADRTSLLLDANNQMSNLSGFRGRSGPLPKDLTHARSKSDLEKAMRKIGIIAPEGNSYLKIAELVESMGLKFNWQATPAEPTPEKIGKALDN